MEVNRTKLLPWQQTLGQDVSLGSVYQADGDFFVSAADVSFVVSLSTDVSTDCYLSASSSFNEDLLALGLSHSQAARIVSSDFPSCHSVSQLLKHLWEKPNFNKQILVGIRRLNEEGLAEEEESSLSEFSVCRLLDAAVVYGVAECQTAEKVEGIEVDAFVSGQQKRTTFAGFCELIAESQTIERFFKTSALPSMKEDSDVAGNCRRFIQTNRTLQLATSLLNNSLVVSNKFLNETLVTIVQAAQNRMIATCNQLSRTFGERVCTSEVKVQSFDVPWLESVENLVQLLNKMNFVAEADDSSEASEALHYQLALAFPNSSPKLLALESFLQTTDLLQQLELLTKKLETLEKIVSANAKNSTFSWRWQLCEDIEVPEFRLSVNRVSCCVESFLVNPSVRVVSVSAQSVQLRVEKPKSDSKDNDICGICLICQFESAEETMMTRQGGEKVRKLQVDLDGEETSVTIDNLRRSSTYRLKYRTQRKLGWCPEVALDCFVTKTCASPVVKSVNCVNPYALEVTVERPVALRGERNLRKFELIVEDKQQKFLRKSLFDASDSRMTLDVDGNGCYSVSAVAILSDKSRSDPSDPVTCTVSASPADLVKYWVLDSSVAIDENGEPALYEIQMNQAYADTKNQVRKMELGKSSVSEADEKVIMIVGETGSGKTTLINSMINYIFGVKYEDKFRFKIVTDPKERSLQTAKSCSQTQWVTSYTFHHTEGCQHPCAFTIVDTPGFGDTGGIVNDKKIIDRIRNFFSSPGGIDHLDALGFVVPSSVARLTPTQRYVFDSILSLFGKDIGENIYVLITFSDANQPPVLESLKDAGIGYNMYIKFNNSAVFAKMEGMDEMSRIFNDMYWKMGMKSFQGFFAHVMNMQAKSLTLTRTVLAERQTLQTHLVSVKAEIDQGLSKLNTLEDEIRVIRDHQSDLDKNRDFTYFVDEDTAVCEKIPSGTYITNCLTCNRTCHYPCGIPDDKDKRGCLAMDGGGNCRECPGKCVWSVHKNMTYQIQTKRARVQKTSEDLKTRYNAAEGKLLSATQLAQKVYDEYLGTRMKVMELVSESKKCLIRLREIALKPDPLSEVDYIDKLIDAERMNKQSGFEDRIQQLNNIRELAMRTEDLKKDQLLNVLIQNEKRVFQKHRDFINKPSGNSVLAFMKGGFNRVKEHFREHF